jgi:phasin
MIAMIDETTKSKTEKLARASVEEGSAQAKKAFDKMSNVTTEATSLMTNSYSTAVKGVQDYNIKAIEFAQANIAAVVDFTQKLSGVKSPADFIEMSSDHSRRQFETLTEQTKELAELAQKIVLATAQPLKTDFTKAFS